jgi:hypothetical protein
MAVARLGWLMLSSNGGSVLTTPVTCDGGLYWIVSSLPSLSQVGRFVARDMSNSLNVS